MVEDLPRGWARTSLGQIVRKARPKIPADPKSELTFGHLDFSLFSAVQGRFGGLKPEGRCLPGCFAA